MSLSRKAIDMIKYKLHEVVEYKEYDTALINKLDDLMDLDSDFRLLEVFKIVSSNKNSKAIESEFTRYFKSMTDDDFNIFINKLNSMFNNISTGTATELVIYLTVLEGVNNFKSYEKIKIFIDCLINYNTGIYSLIEDNVRTDVELDNKFTRFSDTIRLFLGSAIEERFIKSTYILVDYIMKFSDNLNSGLFNLATDLVVNMLCDFTRPIISEDITDMLYSRQIQPGEGGLKIEGIEGVSDLIVASAKNKFYISYKHNGSSRLIHIDECLGFCGIAMHSDIQVIGELMLALGCTNLDCYLARIANTLISQPDDTGTKYVLTPLNSCSSDLLIRGFRLIKRKQGASVRAKDAAEKCRFVIPEGYTISLLN